MPALVAPDELTASHRALDILVSIVMDLIDVLAMIKC